MAELVDAYVSGAYFERSAGSSPVPGTRGFCKRLNMGGMQNPFLLSPNFGHLLAVVSAFSEAIADMRNTTSRPSGVRESPFGIQSLEEYADRVPRTWIGQQKGHKLQPHVKILIDFRKTYKNCLLFNSLSQPVAFCLLYRKLITYICTTIYSSQVKSTCQNAHSSHSCFLPCSREPSSKSPSRQAPPSPTWQ